jgi:hypothetical protein
VTPCKHLNYDVASFPNCELKRDTNTGVQWWDRSQLVGADELARFPETKVRVQFCRKRGRINSIVDCYEDPGPMGCYEPSDDTKVRDK